MKQMAEKKYPGDDDAVSKLTELITAGKGPVCSGTVGTA